MVDSFLLNKELFLDILIFKKVKKMTKKWNFLSIIIICFLASSCSLSGKSSTSNKKNSSNTSITPGNYLYNRVESELNVHYIDLGVSGDSILIDYGDYEVLIDAGGNKSAGTGIITPYLQKYVEDGIIELVIATHGHEDHIAGFIGLSNQRSVFKSFIIKNIIDPGEGYENLSNNNGDLTALQKEYNTLRDKKIADGANYYTIRDIFKNHLEKWTIAPDLTLTFLKTKFYNIPYEKTSQNLNDYSIATLLEYQENSFLFTGDLEEKGEASLIEMNKLSKVNVWKAGHHGSKTASNTEILSIIQPDMAIFTADSTKESAYKFPHPEAINRLIQHTTTFYTSYYNGHVVLNMKKDEAGIHVNCSDNKNIFNYEDYLACYPTIEAIASIGINVTKASLTKIETAENLYKALSAAQKAYVYNYQTLVDARKKYDAL